MLALVEYVKIFTAILVIVNPIGAVPVFVTMAGSQSQQERCGIARLAAFSVAIVLVAACVFGESLLRFFGVSMASFRVGGGILVMLIAIAMFHAQLSWSKATPEETKEAEQKADVAVVPLAIPLLAGPGAISTVIIFADQSSAWAHKGCLIVTCVMVAITVWISLRMAIPIGARLGKTGINIVTRLMSLLLAAIAVEIVAGGLGKLLPGLVKQ
ncbi:MAG: NAAT family transporter [Syntrophobacteraceae bacterium]|jgi:multiple antibiotic resistance protein